MSESIDEDAYANNYHYFQRSLAILSQDADEQCLAMDNFNVAGEIKDEVISNGYAVLNTMSTQLSEQQRIQIKQLLENASGIPEYVVNVPNTKEDHLKAMTDPHWAPLRAQAKQLIAILRAETDRVRAVLYGEQSGC